MPGDPATEPTIDVEASAAHAADAKVAGLTLVHHPDSSRVGQIASLFSSVVGGARSLSRLEPEFRWHCDERGLPLETPLVSRRPLSIRTTSVTVKPCSPSLASVGGRWFSDL